MSTMNTTTSGFHFLVEADAIGAKRSAGLFSRILTNLTEARMREARRLVGGHLATCTDAELESHGFSPEQIAKIRTFPPRRTII